MLFAGSSVSFENQVLSELLGARAKLESSVEAMTDSMKLDHLETCVDKAMETWPGDGSILELKTWCKSKKKLATAGASLAGFKASLTTCIVQDGSCDIAKVLDLAAQDVSEAILPSEDDPSTVTLKSIVKDVQEAFSGGKIMCSRATAVVRFALKHLDKSSPTAALYTMWEAVGSVYGRLT